MRTDGFEPDARVFMVLEGENPASMAKTTGIGLLELATALDNLRPDVVLTVADRFETLATATAAAFMGIPLAHLQGGEVTGSIDDKVRHAVTKLADLHFPATRGAEKRLLRMGEPPDRIFMTGCPSIDLAEEVRASPDLDFDLFERYSGVGQSFGLDDEFMIVMQHPVTTEYSSSREHVLEVLNAVHALGVKALWFWPNVDAGSDGTSSGIRHFRETHSDLAIHFFKNVSPRDFLKLLANCSCIVGNSSVAIREGEFLGVPAVNVGTRQHQRERGANVMDVGYNADEIRDAIVRQMAHGPYDSEQLYGDGEAGARVAEYLATAPLSIEKRLAY